MSIVGDLTMAKIRRLIRRVKQEFGNFYLNIIPRHRARVLIAKDVIKWLDSGRLIALKSCYVDHWGNGIDKIREYKGIPPQPHKCHVCAVGSLFMSRFERGDRIPDGKTSQWFTSLEGFFDLEQLILIETAFEQRIMIGVSLLTDEWEIRNMRLWSPWPADLFRELENVQEWSWSLPTDNNERLREIMHNIIRNKGDLVYDRG